MREADLLAVSLDELGRRDWTVDDYLATKKDLPDAVLLGIVVADRVRAAAQPIASAEFRDRLRHTMAARVQSDANQRTRSTRQSLRQRIFETLVGRVAAPVAIAALAMTGGAVLTAAASAAPDATLYPTKVALERVQLAAAMTPDEKLDIQLHIAMTRLSEASSEAHAGNLFVASALLRQVDVDLAAARATISGAGRTMPNAPSALSADREIAILESERVRVARTDVGDSVEIASADTGRPAAGSDPSKLALGNARVSGATTMVQPHQDSVVNVSSGAYVPVATAVAAVSMTQSPGSDSGVGDSVDQSAQLVFLLLTQVRDGDGDAALATAREYASVLQSIPLTSSVAIGALQDERATIATALADAPLSTQGALDLALSYVDDELAMESSSVATASMSSPLTGSTAPVASPTGSVQSTRPGTGPAGPGVGIQRGQSSGQGANATIPTNPIAKAPPVAVPTRQPQFIGKPTLPVGSAPTLPIALPAPGAALPPHAAAAPPSRPNSPVVSIPVLARAPARIVAPKRVPSNKHSKIGK